VFKIATDSNDELEQDRLMAKMQYDNARSPELFVHPSHTDTNNNNNAINLEDTLAWATCHKYQSAHILQQK
jgi:hypothetical protein